MLIKARYWNFEMEQEIEFPCENKTQPESDKCIFHDEHFLDDDKNRQKIKQEFQHKIHAYLSKNDNGPLFCIGYRLCDIDIKDKEFSNSVYFNAATISGSFNISSKFHNHVSFTRAQFSGKGRVSFAGARFSGNGHVDFIGARFSGNGPLDFAGAEFSGNGHVDFTEAEFSGKGEINFSDG